MGNYNKLIGSIIGGAVGLGLALGLPLDFMTPELQAGITTIIGAALVTFWAPKNTG